jgi:hypothetical protein
VRGRPDDGERASDHFVLGDGAAAGIAGVRARVGRIVAVVALDPELAGRDHDDVLRLTRRERLVGVVAAGVEVAGLVQGRAVDDQLATRIAAVDPVTGDPDHPLDEVLVPRGGEAEETGHVANDPHDHIRRRRDRVLGRPGVDPVEDDDLTALDVADLVREPIDDHPVVDLEGVHHRARRDVVRREQEGVHHHRDDHREHHEEDALHPQRALRGVLRPATVAVAGSGVLRGPFRARVARRNASR